MATISPLYKRTGISLLYAPLTLVGLLVAVGLIALGMSKNWLLTTAFIFGLPIALGYTWQLLKDPRVGVWTVLVYCFTWSMISRYIFAYTRIQLPWGLGVDGLLAMSLGAIILAAGLRTHWQVLQDKFIALTFLWGFFIFLQLFNPAATSRVAWFYAMRTYAFYHILSIVICYMVLNQRKDLDRFFIIFIGFSIVGAIYGWYQLNIGLNYADSIFIQPKLDRHMLFGKLRVFSIYENAGQAGVSQGQAGVLANILFIHEKRKAYKWFYFIGMCACYYGMAISGTRGALIVPIAGMGVYLFWCRMPKVTIAGSLVGSIALFLLVFTNIGQSNYTINRMRTAFDPDDPSLQYRLEARAHYKDYMEKHFFGWGVGTAGYWGNRFNGDDNVMKGTDGGYVQIQAEVGFGGLLFYWFYYGFVLGMTFLMLIQMPYNDLYPKILALSCGVIGLLLANYGNSVTFQLPSNLTVSISLAYIWMARHWVAGKDYPVFESRF